MGRDTRFRLQEVPCVESVACLRGHPTDILF
ncbi:hypothetical protein J2Z50_000157 [Ensifer mexicanus]|nr:hypothetical protein [Sinorhizobium mexicanum]